MKRIQESRKLFNIDHTADLGALKVNYRSMMKLWHPDKFHNDPEQAVVAEQTSQSIIEAYHFLVSIHPETHEVNAESYALTINSCVITDFEYKGQTLKVTFQDGSIYEYFGVPRNIYVKLVNSPTQTRFARRHIFQSFVMRNVTKSAVLV